MKEVDNAGVLKSEQDTTLMSSSMRHITHIPGLIRVILEVSGDKGPFSVRGVTVTVRESE